MMRGAVVLALLLCARPPLADAQQLLPGHVIAVHDGDTISVRTAKATLRVRLADIDCPEMAQPHGALRLLL